MNSVLHLFLVCLITSNVCAMTGSAVPLTIAHKRSFAYTCLVSLIFTLILIASGMAYYMMVNYVFSRFNIGYLSLMFLVVVVGILNFLAYYLLKKINVESFYIYEKSYTFMFMMVSVMAVVLMQDLTITLPIFFATLVFLAVGFSVVNFFIYGAYYKVNGAIAPDYLKGLPLILILLSVLSLAFWVLSSAL